MKRKVKLSRTRRHEKGLMADKYKRRAPAQIVRRRKRLPDITNITNQAPSQIARRQDMNVIDVHCHVFPLHFRTPVYIRLKRWGMKDAIHNSSPGALINRMGKVISKAFIHSIPTIWGRTLDKYIRKVSRNPKFYGFLSPMDTDFNEKTIGVKLHASLQDIEIYEIDVLLDKLAETRRMLMFHIGPDFLGGNVHEKVLEQLRNLFNSYNKVTVIIPHFHGIDVLKDCRNVIFDTSFVADEAIRKFVRSRGGIDRVVFGSDFPIRDPIQEMERIKSLGFGEENLKKIFYENIQKRLKMIEF